jgi:precorrin-2/cobalt-factor-2 C20-methyltransferase
VVPYVLSYGAPVRKTSVYLPDALKRRLAAAAESTHRSEADLVREAIEQRVTAGSAPAADVADAPVPGRLVGVGVGPGAPDLLTVRALRALRRATVVVAPCTDASAIGRAEAIVREAAPDVVVERLVFVMAPAQAERAEALDAATARVVELLEAGEEVAFITLGDPNVYSTFSSVAAAVRATRPSAPVVTVPGVMAFQELAARADLVLTDEQQTLVVLPANSSDGALDTALDDPTRTIVLYKGGRRLPDIAKRLDATDRIDGAVLGELLGMPGERIAHVADVADRPASYLSAVIVPAKEGT